MFRFLRYLFTRRIRLDGRYVTSAQADQINERTRKGREFEQEMRKRGEAILGAHPGVPWHAVDCQCPGECQPFRSDVAEGRILRAHARRRELHRVHEIREAAWNQRRAKPMRPPEAALDQFVDGCDLPITRELLGIGPSGPVFAVPPLHDIPREHAITGDWTAEELNSIMQAPDGSVVASHIPARIIGRVLPNGFTIITRDSQGPDESAGDHNADPRNDTDLVIGLGAGRTDRVPEPARKADRWTGGPDRIVPL